MSRKLLAVSEAATRCALRSFHSLQCLRRLALRDSEGPSVPRAGRDSVPRAAGRSPATTGRRSRPVTASPFQSHPLPPHHCLPSQLPPSLRSVGRPSRDCSRHQGVTGRLRRPVARGTFGPSLLASRAIATSTGARRRPLVGRQPAREVSREPASGGSSERALTVAAAGAGEPPQAANHRGSRVGWGGGGCGRVGLKGLGGSRPPQPTPIRRGRSEADMSLSAREPSRGFHGVLHDTVGVTQYDLTAPNQSETSRGFLDQQFPRPRTQISVSHLTPR